MSHEGPNSDFDVKPVSLDNSRSFDTKMVMAGGIASRKNGRAMPRKEEENDLNILRALFMFAIMTCVLLEIYSWYTSRLCNSW